MTFFASLCYHNLPSLRLQNGIYSTNRMCFTTFSQNVMDSRRCLKQSPFSHCNPFCRIKSEVRAGGETIVYKAFPGTSQQVTFASAARFPIIIPAHGICLPRVSLGVWAPRYTPSAPPQPFLEWRANNRLNFSLVLADGAALFDLTAR